LTSTGAMPTAMREAERATATRTRRRAGDVATIGLCMIVKNESKVIGRCLTSMLPLVDYILVVDTGSEDGTQQIIRDFLAEHDIAGAVIEEPWQNFAYNRTFALERLREVERIDYAFMIDADDTVVLDDGFDPRVFKSQLDHDLYDVQVLYADIAYARPQICSNRLPFSYKGVLHEYLEAPPCDLSRADASGFRIKITGGGARSNNPRKFQDDAALLERTLQTETDPFLISRYTFYLAQSYKDCGEKAKALPQYLARAEMGFWQEEVFVALYQAARLKEELGYPEQDVIDAYARASDALPLRAEALHGAAKFCRSKGRNEEGFQLAKRGVAIGKPNNGLFVESWIYDYGLLDELAINGYWSGHYHESADACVQILLGETIAEHERKRILANLRFALTKLPPPSEPNLGSRAKDDLLAQHAIGPARDLRSRLADPGTAPRVLVAILAKQKAKALPLYLECIEALDYPKSSVVLYIRTNNNTDQTKDILREWVDRIGHLYAGVEFDAEDVADRVEQFGVHEWNPTRFRVLGRIRNISLRRALEQDCDFYFVADVDNFVRPCTLRELVALNLPIAAPLLRSISPESFYSNYHAEIDANGYYKDCDQYQWVLNRWIVGVQEMPVVHCTYLIRADVLPDLTYEDATDRFEYVVFSDSARKNGVPQYLDNRQVYGYITFDEGDPHHVDNGLERARELLRDDLSSYAEKAPTPAPSDDRARLDTLTNRSPGVIPVSGKNVAPKLPPMYVINLDRAPDRLRLFSERNQHLGRVTRVSASDGSKLDRKELTDTGYLSEDCPYLAGALGCALSHVILWKMAASQDRSITVFEDDIAVSRHFVSQATALLSVLPDDWDFIQWGYILNPLFAWVDLGVSRVRLQPYGPRPLSSGPGIRRFQSEPVCPAPLKLLHSFGFQGYSVSAKGARAALDHCLPLRRRLITFPDAGVTTPDCGIDVAMCGLYPKLNAFICAPPLLIHCDKGTSNRETADRLSAAETVV
jgi:GR25 family glycosyltransferase involved in LPS biosynthesis/glycosyltransferase involved in cell wall biosynthesis